MGRIPQFFEATAFAESLPAACDPVPPWIWNRLGRVINVDAFDIRFGPKRGNEMSAPLLPAAVVRRSLYCVRRT